MRAMRERRRRRGVLNMGCVCETGDKRQSYVIRRCDISIALKRRSHRAGSEVAGTGVWPLTCELDGVRHPAVEVQLVYKAGRMSPRSPADFQACEPYINLEQRDCMHCWTWRAQATPGLSGSSMRHLDISARTGVLY